MTMQKKRPFVKMPFHFNHVAIDDFYEKYPEFYKAGKMEFCSCIYYPIADLELELLEASSEEFETIEHSILELIYSGIVNTKQIADMMGLPEKYVKKIISLLEGYGQLLEMKVTDIGRKSVLEGVKYTKFTTRQKIQADPIFGVLLTKEISQSKGQLFKADKTNNKIPHVQPDPYVEHEMFEELFDDLSRYRKGRKKVFHTNVIQIEQVISKQICYAYAFLVKFEKLDEPLILLKCRHQQRKDSSSDVFYWKPIAITRQIEEMLALQDYEFTVVPFARFESMKQLVKDVKKQLSYIRKTRYEFPNKGEALLGSDWCVDPNQVEFEMKDNCIYLYIEPGDFQKTDKFWLKSLLSYKVLETAKPYVRFAANHTYPGLVCYGKTTNRDLNKLITKLQKTIKTGKDLERFYVANREILEKTLKIEEKIQKLMEA